MYLSFQTMFRPLQSLAKLSMRHHPRGLKHCHQKLISDGSSTQKLCVMLCSSNSGSDHLRNVQENDSQEATQQQEARQIPKEIQYHLDRLDELDHQYRKSQKYNKNVASESFGDFNDDTPASNTTKSLDKNSHSSTINFSTNGNDSFQNNISSRPKLAKSVTSKSDSYKDFLSKLESCDGEEFPARSADSISEDIDLYLESGGSLVSVDDDTEYNGNDIITTTPYTRGGDSEPPLPSELLKEKKELIRKSIISSKSYSEVMAVFQQYKADFTPHHYDNIAFTLSNIFPYKSELPSCISSDVLLLELCETMFRLSRRYDVGMLLNLLNLLMRMQLPETSTIMIGTLQLTKHKINEMEIRQLLFLDNVLSSQNARSINLSNAIKMAIPILLEIKLSVPAFPLLPKVSWFLLIRGFNLGVKEKSVVIAEKFMMAIYEANGELQELSPNALVMFVSSLLDMKSMLLVTTAEGKDGKLHQNVAREVLLKEALHQLTRAVSDLPPSTMERLMRILSHAYAFHHDRCAYSQAMLNKFAHRAVDENWSIKAMANAVTTMLKMDEMDEPLVSRLFTRFQDVKSSELEKMYFVMPIIHAFASSQCVAAASTIEKHDVLNRLLQHHSVTCPKQDAPLSRLACDLLLLDYHSTDVSAAVTRNMLAYVNTCMHIPPSQLSRPQITNLMQYIRLWQTYMLLRPSNVGELQLSLEQQQYLESVVLHLASGMAGDFSISRSYDRGQIRQMLQHCLRCHSPDTVVAGVYTQHLLLLDYLVVMQADGQVVPQPAAAVEKGGVSINDLFIPNNAKLLGILKVGPRQVLNNCTKLRSHLKLDMKLLEAEGVTVVPLLMQQLFVDNKTEEQKLQYIVATLHQHGLYI